MATFKLEIVTAERMVFSDEVSALIAWGFEGQLAILPHHAPLMTMLQPGDLMIRKDKEEDYLAITGGFLEARPEKVIVLADACERAEEIDAARAEAAKERAQKALRTATTEVGVEAAKAALHRSLARLKAVEKIRRKRSGGGEVR
jgi:F-type H+-transporting ATPase subunit epsilon